MKKEIQYGGYSANRSDYESEDGELAVSMGVVNEEGQLRHVLEPKVLCKVPEGYDVVFIHKTATYEHYILRYFSGRVAWELAWADASEVAQLRPDETMSVTFIHSFDSEIYEVNAVGNTLVVLAADGMHYVLWKKGGYNYLGQKPPMVELQFGLSRSDLNLIKDQLIIKGVNPQYTENIIDTGEEWGVYFEYCGNYFNISNNQAAIRVKNARRSQVKDNIYTILNKTNAAITRIGRFYAPFFVRYCYRMHDGSQWMHSAPVFMPVSMPRTMDISVGSYSIGTGNTKQVYRYFAQCVALKVKEEVNGSFDSLKTVWGDIIKSIDIFVSTPLIRETTDEDIVYGFEKAQSAMYKPIYNLTEQYNGTNNVPCLKERNYTGTYSDYGGWLFRLPMVADEGYHDTIRSVANFYKVASYNLESDSIPADYTEVNINKFNLMNLTTVETMKDDYKYHNQLLPSTETNLFTYNNRLHVSALKEKLFNGFNLNELLPGCVAPSPTGIDYELLVKSMYVYFNTEQGERAVCTFSENNYNISISRTLLHTCPLFYPDNRVTRIVMEVYDGVYPESPFKVYEFRMNDTLLNGKMSGTGGIMSTQDLSELTFEEAVNWTAPVIIDEIEYPNKIYTSEVDNPFVFPVEGINTVGTGQILGISTAAKALSQGQFGQFPLYAFTTDGVWALRVTDTGTYSAVQPVTRDVVLDAESIAQLDDAVLFATQRGLMVISGSEARCISDVLLTDEQFDLGALPHLAGLLPEGFPTEVKPFKDFLNGCRMNYDYLHQRIWVFNPTLSVANHYAYVFSLKSKLWGMVPCNLSKALNSYPDALALTRDGMLVTLAESTEGVDSQHPVSLSLLVTRPIAIGDPNAFKSVHTVVQRGMFRKGSVQSLLYASRDLWHWHLIGSSVDHWVRGLRGSGYKWFRIVVLATLPKGESVSGATVEYELREVNKIH